MLRNTSLAIVFALLSLSRITFAESPKSLKDALLPAPKEGGFAMEGQYLWCSSVIKVDDTYHLFASRWPAKFGMGGWTSYSEIVRATSKDLLGPYQFEEVVLQKREDHWDKSRAHNVKVIQVGSKFILYYINTANETGYAVADQITGPWTRCEAPVIRASNPAPIVREDGSIYVLCRKATSGVNRMIGFTASTCEGPYTMLANGDNLLPNGGELEDPCIWWANNQFNVLLNDWKGHATGINKAGAQYFSKDGLKYELASKDPVFTKEVKFDDGSAETFARRERPFVFVNDKQEAIALFTACLPKSGDARIVVQPIDRYVPGN